MTDGHLRWPVTLSPIAERLAVELSLLVCFYDLGLSRPGIEPRSPVNEANALPLGHRGDFGVYIHSLDFPLNTRLTKIVQFHIS